MALQQVGEGRGVSGKQGHNTGSSAKEGLWKFCSSLCLFHCSVLCGELSRIGQCLNPGQKSSSQVEDDCIQLALLGFLMPTFQSNFLFPSHKDLCQATSVTAYMSENLYRCTYAHVYTLFSKCILGYSSMQKSNKVRDETAFYHSTLCAGP